MCGSVLTGQMRLLKSACRVNWWSHFTLPSVINPAPKKAQPYSTVRLCTVLYLREINWIWRFTILIDSFSNGIYYTMSSELRGVYFLRGSYTCPPYFGCGCKLGCQNRVFHFLLIFFHWAPRYSMVMIWASLLSTISITISLQMNDNLEKASLFYSFFTFLAPPLEELYIFNSAPCLTTTDICSASLSLSHLLWSAYISALCYPTTSVVSTTITIVVWSYPVGLVA